MRWKCAAIEGDSPVRETIKSLVTFLSTAEHVEFCGNLGRPLSKAKYQEGPIVN